MLEIPCFDVFWTFTRFGFALSFVASRGIIGQEVVLPKELKS